MSYPDRVRRLNGQAKALAQGLEEQLAGRPVDVVTEGLALAAARVVCREGAFSAVGSTRRDRLRFALHVTQVAALAAGAINEEGP